MKRRQMIAGMAALGAAALAGALRFTDLLVKHYPPTPYDDVLAHLIDRAQAAKLGAAMHEPGDAKALAARLRATLGGELRVTAAADAAAGRVREADGWIVPDCVALLSALAAKV